MTAPIASGWSDSPGGPRTHWKAPPFTAHAELGHFLADPERRIWTFKAAEAERAHVRGTAMRARCDLDLTIDKRGRPYSLVCTKNQASYDRRANQRKQDLEDLARLDH